MLDALRCRYREILYARPLGNKGLALVTFQGKRPPRTVLYHDFITKVCTKKPRCPDCGCITQEGHVCERTYCVNCHALKHLATNPKCPARIRADQMLQQKSKRGKPSNKRRCTATAASTKEKPPQVTIEDFPLLNRDSSSHRKAPDTGRSRSKSTSAGLHTGRKASRSASRNGHKRNRSRGRSTSARRANSRDYAQAVRKPQGYYADDEHEVRAWQEELRAIDTEKQADNDRYKRLEAELMQLKRKMEESDRRRDARRNTILGHIKAAMEARRAGREQQRQQKEQHVGNPTPEMKESAPSTQVVEPSTTEDHAQHQPDPPVELPRLSQRRAELNHRLKDQTFNILLLQETKTDQITIPGYKQYYMPSIKHTYKKEEKIQAQAAIFIQEKMHHIIIDTSRWCTELQEVVAIRVALQSTERRLTIASAYLRPQKKRDYSWIMHLRKDYPDDFRVLGQAQSWGQPNKNPHAKALYEIMEQADVTMANDPIKPTRYPTIANQREFIIDITLTPANTARMLHWTVLDDAWGSDHFPIIIELNIGAKSKHPKKQTKTIIWDKFRQNLLDQGDDFEPHHVTSLLTAAAKVAVDTRQVDEDTPTPDSHLLSLWDRRTKTLTLYSKTRKRKHLTKVNWLTNEASKYAKQLGLERWLERSKTYPTNLVVFFPQPQKKPDPGIYQRQHTGPSQNPGDLPFTEWELDAAIKQCRTKSAPGPDGVTVPMLRNAPDPTRKAMLAWFNRIWDSGVLPDEWKTSVVTPIPKPGKPAIRIPRTYDRSL
ncbi:hypothetical protein HPB47_002690 [Ixodes persulcatus]|uniref:Uncharacterized protein n=1 Tax=Ixodes persulcatus TaxID=34615 RepID=A0AC60PM81_IXOPE|nr:hypothetical protein HPB47_002690 [Ixodes persulcatus]